MGKLAGLSSGRLPNILFTILLYSFDNYVVDI